MNRVEAISSLVSASRVPVINLRPPRDVYQRNRDRFGPITKQNRDLDYLLSQFFSGTCTPLLYLGIVAPMIATTIGGCYRWLVSDSFNSTGKKRTDETWKERCENAATMEESIKGLRGKRGNGARAVFVHVEQIIVRWEKESSWEGRSRGKPFCCSFS